MESVVDVVSTASGTTAGAGQSEPHPIAHRAGRRIGRDRRATPATRRPRSAVAALAALAIVAGLAGCSSAPPVEETGHTTTVEVRMIDGKYVPDILEVPLGDRLVIELVNDDGDLHDLELANGVKSGRFGKGQSETMDVGVVGGDIAGWCTIPPHREHGMLLQIHAVP